MDIRLTVKNKQHFAMRDTNTVHAPQTVFSRNRPRTEISSCQSVHPAPNCAAHLFCLTHCLKTYELCGYNHSTVFYQSNMTSTTIVFYYKLVPGASSGRNETFILHRIARRTQWGRFQTKNPWENQSYDLSCSL